MLWQRFTEASPSRLRGLLCWVPGLLKCFFKTMMQYRNSLHRDILNISLTFIIPEINTLTLTINLFSHYHWWIFFFFFKACHQPSQLLRWYHNEMMGTGEFEHSRYSYSLCHVLFFFSVGNLGGECGSALVCQRRGIRFKSRQELCHDWLCREITEVDENI